MSQAEATASEPHLALRGVRCAYAQTGETPGPPHDRPSSRLILDGADMAVPAPPRGPFPAYAWNTMVFPLRS